MVELPAARRPRAHYDLHQLLTAEQLEQTALEEPGIDSVVGAALAQARQRFENALPGVKDMRDALMHFDEWSRGEGRGPQATRRKAGDALRDIARDYWPFGYDSTAGTVSFGPYVIDVDSAERAATELTFAIWVAVCEEDKGSTAELRINVVEALGHAGVPCTGPNAILTISPGTDLRIWLSLNLNRDSEERRGVSELTVSALGDAGLHLDSTHRADAWNSVEQLERGDSLYVVVGHVSNGTIEPM